MLYRPYNVRNEIKSEIFSKVTYRSFVFAILWRTILLSPRTPVIFRCISIDYNRVAVVLRLLSIKIVCFVPSGFVVTMICSCPEIDNHLETNRRVPQMYSFLHVAKSTRNTAYCTLIGKVYERRGGHATLWDKAKFRWSFAFKRETR